MKRLNQTQINQINSLILEGKSLNQISCLIGKNKTTIYYHFRKIKGLTIKKTVVNKNDEELIGEFIGLFAGDGCFNKDKNNHYKIYLYFNITEEKYVEELKEVLKRLFGKHPMQFRRENRIILAYYSKNIFNFIKEYLDWNLDGRKSHSVHLKHREQNKLFKIGFLRGCLDSDGYFSDNCISFATSSPELAENIISFLEDLEINHNHSIYKEKRPNRVNMHHIKIKTSERNRFIELINPRERKNIGAMRRPGLS